MRAEVGQGGLPELGGWMQDELQPLPSWEVQPLTRTLSHTHLTMSKIFTLETFYLPWSSVTIIMIIIADTYQMEIICQKLHL